MLIDIATVFLGIFLAQLAPGPNPMAVSAASLGAGRLPGLAVAAGVASGVVIWAVLFAFGIGALVQVFPETLTLMRFLGGGYLIYMGVHALWATFGHGGGWGPAAARSILAPPAAYRRGRATREVTAACRRSVEAAAQHAGDGAASKGRRAETASGDAAVEPAG